MQKILKKLYHTSTMLKKINPHFYFFVTTLALSALNIFSMEKNQKNDPQNRNSVTFLLNAPEEVTQHVSNIPHAPRTIAKQKKNNKILPKKKIQTIREQEQLLFVRQTVICHTCLRSFNDKKILESHIRRCWAICSGCNTICSNNITYQDHIKNCVHYTSKNLQ